MEEILQEEFKRNYEEYLPRKTKASGPQTSKKAVRIIYSNLFCLFKSFQSRNNDSNDPESSSSSSDEEEFADELDRYLTSGRIKGVDDPIQWWHENQVSYPHLSRMAKDYLTIPGRYSLIIYLYINC